MKRIILVYHGIGNTDKFMEVNFENFQSQIQYLVRKNFNFCNINELMAKNSGNNVSIMFDDALLSSSIGIDYLEKIKKKYSIAVIENFVNNKGYLTEKKINSLEYATLYFHTANHKDLTSLNKKELDLELKNDKKYINQEVIVYPMGKYNDYIIKYLDKNKIKYGLTVLPFHLKKKQNHYEIPRICINGYLNFLKFKMFISKIGNIYLHLAFLKRKILKQSYLEK